jgi:pyruvate ferredoxin oxidoreductase gamma subunit
MLAQAAFTEGRQVQSFPNFGSERMGAPVLGYVRIDDSPITTHEPIQIPNAVVVQDPTLLTALPVFQGLDADSGYAIINTIHPPEVVKAQHDDAPENTITIPADAIVREYLGQNKPAAAMLAAFAAATGAISLDSIIEAFEGRFKGAVANGNIAAAKVAYQMVKDGWTPPQAGPGFNEELEAQIIEIGAGLGLADDEE